MRVIGALFAWGKAAGAVTLSVRRGGRDARAPRLVVTRVLGIVSAVACVAQSASDVADISKLVESGRIEALEVRLHGRSDAQALHALGFAHANRAAAETDDAQRDKAIAAAQERFDRWIAAVDQESAGQGPQRAAVANAEARLAYAGVILTRWANRDLDEREISDARRGDAERLHNLLTTALDLYDDVLRRIDPLAGELREGGYAAEERFLALGVFDDVRRIGRDARFNRAWTNYYLAGLEPNPEDREASLRSAHDVFTELLDAGHTGDAAARCALGRALTLRARDKFDAARDDFDLALRSAEHPTLLAQIRYEHARSEFAAGRFDEGRLLVRPLLDIDESRLTPEQRGALFYVNLARLWDANSFLQEATVLQRAGADSAAREAIARRAAQIRESGLLRMNRLAARGGAWPDLVQLYVDGVLTKDALLDRSTPAELLFRARAASEADDYARAAEILRAAESRGDMPAELRGEVLFELGRALAKQGELRAAVDVFERMFILATPHPRASEVAAYDYQLWSQIAAASGRPEDFRQLAGALLRLLERFPQHPQREDAMWWLPVALQSAGDFAAAAEHYGNVPAASPHWEQAQYRGVMCLRRAWLEESATNLGPAAALKARRVADELRAYAEAALQRAPHNDDGEQVRAWAGDALIRSAEILASDGVEQHQAALDALVGFESRVATDGLVPRVLALRIRAYGGLRDFDSAARVIETFLQSASPAEVGPALARIAEEMQAEAERLSSSGSAEAAKRLAADAAPVFERLLDAMKPNGADGPGREAVQYGLARMKLISGDAPAARDIAGSLVEHAPRNGDYLRLFAQSATAALDTSAGEDELTAARDAWARILADANLKVTQPDRYWEARLETLRLTRRLGKADDVRRAIEQMRVWDPELGGPTWRAQFDALYEQIASTRRPPPTSQP